MKRLFTVLCLLSSVLWLSACASTPVQLNHADRLLARPDFPAARAAAPEWCRDALKTINALEADLERP